jgi:hypothetical protein
LSASERIDRVLFEPVLGRLDRVRARALRATAVVNRGFVRDRGRRVVAMAAFACATALLASAFATGWLLLVGPLVFGVAHLAAEARYLFFQTHRRNRVLLAILVVQTVLVFAGLGIFALGPCCVLALVAVRGDAPSRRDVALFALAVLMTVAAAVAPTWSRFALLHGHNFVPLLVWLFWRERPRHVSLFVAATVTACVVAITGGAFDGLPIRTPLSDTAFSLTRITDAVAGELAGPWRARCLLLFAFTQSIHYAFWLRLVPEEARARETPRSWRASWRAFEADAGPRLAQLAVLVAFAVPALALVLGPVRARSFYVTASEFHATVETILVLVLMRGLRSPAVPRSARACARAVPSRPSPPPSASPPASA